MYYKITTESDSQIVKLTKYEYALLSRMIYGDKDSLLTQEYFDNPRDLPKYADGLEFVKLNRDILSPCDKILTIEEFNLFEDIDFSETNLILPSTLWKTAHDTFQSFILLSKGITNDTYIYPEYNLSFKCFEILTGIKKLEDINLDNSPIDEYSIFETLNFECKDNVFDTLFSIEERFHIFNGIGLTFKNNDYVIEILNSLQNSIKGTKYPKCRLSPWMCEYKFKTNIIILFDK